MRIDNEWSEVEVNRDVALIATDINIDVANIAKEEITENTWLGDSAASCHLYNDNEGMFDWKHINAPIKIGNGKALIRTKIGKLRQMIVQKDGTTVDVILTEVQYVPKLWVNLFSIGKALKNGFNIGNKGIKIFLTK
jgi:hypothetical protein